jgi:hypothetical protein
MYIIERELIEIIVSANISFSFFRWLDILDNHHLITSIWCSHFFNDRWLKDEVEPTSAAMKIVSNYSEGDKCGCFY